MCSKCLAWHMKVGNFFIGIIFSLGLLGYYIQKGSDAFEKQMCPYHGRQNWKKYFRTSYWITRTIGQPVISDDSVYIQIVM